MLINYVHLTMAMAFSSVEPWKVQLEWGRRRERGRDAAEREAGTVQALPLCSLPPPRTSWRPRPQRGEG